VNNPDNNNQKNNFTGSSKGDAGADPLANFKPFPEGDKPSSKAVSRKVLVVYGHDTDMKTEVVSILNKLKFEVILNQAKGDSSRPLNKRAKEFKDVSFVVVILYPDDVAYHHQQNQAYAQLRAVQNLVFEFGFWLGKFGRDRVFVLFHEKKKFRLPSDYSDAIYVRHDSTNLWIKELVNRLTHCGLDCGL